MDQTDEPRELFDYEIERYDELSDILREVDRLLRRVIDLGGDLAGVAEKLLLVQEAVKAEMLPF